MIALLLAAAPARGEETLRLNEITVRASRVDALLPARTEVDREEIIDSHKDELPEVLDLTPGVNVRDGGRGEPRLDVRGFDQRAVLFTLNGVPVYDPWNGMVNLNLFPLEMLGGIEIDRGPSSALFGPNGMAGTVKLDTFRPRAPLTGAASAIWRNSDYWDARASGSVSRGGAQGLLGGRYLTSPGFPLPGDFDELPESRRRYENGGLRLNSDDEEKSLFATASYDDGEQGRAHLVFLGSTASFGEAPSTTAFLGPFRRTDRQDLVHAQGGAERRLTPTLGAAAAVFYTGYDTDESAFTDATFAERILTTKVDAAEVGGIGRLTLDIGDSDSLAGGVQVRRGGADVSDDVNGALSNSNATTSNVSAENVYVLGDWLSLVAGLSLDMQNAAGRTHSRLDPQLGASFDFGVYGTSRAAVSRKIRFPTLRELFDREQGNSSLGPEQAIVYEVGHRFEAARGYADLNLFRNDVSDLIANRGGDRGEFVNIQDAILQGLELAFGGTPFEWMRLDVNYTYLNTQATDTTKIGTSESDVQHKPPHRFNGILQLFLPFESLLRLEGIYTSSQLDQFATGVTVDSYTLFNVQLTRRLGRWGQLFAGVNNALDAYHEDKLGSPGPGRWVFVGVRLSYE